MAIIVSVAVSAPPASALDTFEKYVALGDSVASGAGLGGDLDPTCDRSSLAYPSLLADKLGTSVTNLACSGAKVDEGIYGSQYRNGASLPAQLDAAYVNGAPDLITITIGANDVRWANYLRDCYVFDCGSGLDKARAVVYRADLRYELMRTLQMIEDRGAADPPTVLINGYYGPFARVDCNATNDITTAEKDWIHAQKGYLNDSLRTVVRNFDFAEFVHQEFNGHKVCSSDPWLQGPESLAPFHPNAAGQQSIADSNYRTLSR